METFDTFVQDTTKRYMEAKHEAEERQRESLEALKRVLRLKWQALADKFLAKHNLNFPEVKAVPTRAWETMSPDDAAGVDLVIELGQLGQMKIALDRYFNDNGPHFSMSRIVCRAWVDGGPLDNATFEDLKTAIACMNLLRLMEEKQAREAQTLADVDR